MEVTLVLLNFAFLLTPRIASTRVAVKVLRTYIL